MIGHSMAILLNTQSRLKCPDIENLWYFNFHTAYYSFVLLIVTMSELFINLAISVHIFKNDQVMKGLLPNTVLKRRHRENAIGLAGHLVSFCLKWLSFGLWHIAIKQMIPPWIGGNGSLIVFSGISSLCNIAFSRPLKSELGKLTESCKGTRRCVDIIQKIKSNT